MRTYPTPLSANEQVRGLFLTTVAQTIGSVSSRQQVSQQQSWTFNRPPEPSEFATRSHLRLTRWLDSGAILQRPVDASVAAAWGGAHFLVQRSIRFSNCDEAGQLYDTTVLGLTGILRDKAPIVELRKTQLGRALGALIEAMVRDPTLPNFSAFAELDLQNVQGAAKATSARLGALIDGGLNTPESRDPELCSAAELTMEGFLQLPGIVGSMQPAEQFGSGTMFVSQ